MFKGFVKLLELLRSGLIMKVCSMCQALGLRGKLIQGLQGFRTALHREFVWILPEVWARIAAKAFLSCAVRCCYAVNKGGSECRGYSRGSRTFVVVSLF